ncbi:MAG: hypothetical protein KKH04_21565 [Proteobacteria bacterium]|nr:hypothetical protein [Pseudomonadota bacterium]
MNNRHKLVEEWLADNHQKMIHCPYQPGNLIISPKACFQRYKFGRKKKLNNFFTDEFFYHKVKKGLSLCGQCPMGKKWLMLP